METQTKVIIGIPILLTGGTEMQTLNLVQALCGSDYHVTVLCYYEYERAMVKYMEDAGSEVVLMKLRRSDGLLFLFKKLVGKFKELSPAIVHVQYVAPGFVPIIAARVAGVRKLIATVHQPGRTYGWQAGVILRTAARFCNIFFCVSKSAEKSWFGSSELFDPKNINNKKKHFTIYNAVDVDHIEQISKKVAINKLKNKLGINNKPIIGVIGRLRWEKGQDILLNAMPAVIKAIPNVMLLVVGDGPDRISLEQSAKSLGIKENIRWLGQKNQQKVFELYSIMDVMAVPSIFEGFGLTAAEAMAAGLPVVASYVDGLSEVVEDGRTGYLVPPGDSTIMAERITDLLSHPTKAAAMGEAGRRRVMRHFSMERFAESMLSVYRCLG